MNDLMTKSFLSYMDLNKEALKDLEAAGPEEDATAGIKMAAAGGGNLDSFFEEARVVRFISGGNN